MNQTRKEREQSYFYNMRRFHNQIKRNLYNKYTKKGDEIMELAVGKSGDMQKWISNNVKRVVGYDIYEPSIEEGKRRVLEAKSKGKIPEIELYVKDLSRNVLDGDKGFDVVSSMFAFHYFFESKETFNTIMSSIDNNLKDGGYFMGAMFDGEKIKNLLNKGDYILNDNNETRFIIKKYDNFSDNLFGNKISVFLRDTVLDEPMDEYLVYFNDFVRVIKERGYNLIESKMFNELSNPSFNLNNLSKNISFLNRTFVFKRNKVESIEVKVESKCKKEKDYLIECEWEMSKQEKTLNKYKKALTKKINMTSNEFAKNDYKFIRDNFENVESILKNDDISNSIKTYFSDVYKMYINDVN
jgi:hypothetical protein